ncbi:MAG: hypothetical protein WBY94_26760 [Polyangiaceae bacterium]
MAGDPSNDMRVLPPKPCEGCGKAAHGSVNAGILCLQESLRKARAELRAANETLAAFRAWQALRKSVQESERERLEKLAAFDKLALERQGG